MTDPHDPAAPGAQHPGPVPPHPQQPGPYPGQPYQGQPYQGQPYPGQQHAGQQWGASAAPKPGVIPLRPLGVGEILDGAVSYIRANPVATLGLAAIVITITQVIQVPALALVTSQPSPADLESGGMAVFTGLMLTTFLGAFLYLVAAIAVSGMLVVVLAQAVTGRRVGIGEAWAAVRGRVPGLVGLTLLVGLLIGLVVVVGALPLAIGAAVGSGAAAVIGVVLVLASVVFAVWLGVSWSLAAPAYVLEGIPVTAALRRSFGLVRRSWWRVFGILLLGGLITTVISVALQWPFTLLAGLFGGAVAPGSVGATSVLVLVVTAIGTIIATTVTTPFSAGISGLLYIDQRIRREALDIELARTAQR